MCRFRQGGIFLSLALVSLAGCGERGDGILDQFPPVTPVPTPPEGGAELTGSFDGSNIFPEYAFSDRVTNADGERAGVVILTEDPNMCEDWNDQAIDYGAEFVIIANLEVSGSDANAPSEPGVYEIGGTSGKVTVADYIRIATQSCGIAQTVGIDSGQVELVAVSANYYGGTLDGLTQSDDEIKAAFNPIPCAGIEYWYNQGVSCQ